MSVFVKNLSDSIKLLIQTFNLSAIFPSTVFVVLCQFFLLPILPEDMRFYENWPSDTRTIVVIIGVILLSYLLDAINFNLIRLFEGYYLINLFPISWIREQNQILVKETLSEIRKFDNLSRILLQQAREEAREDLVDLAEDLNSYKRTLLKRISNKYPEKPEFVLPTLFGNVIAAAEQYPKKVFGIDAIILWPFLAPVLIEKNYAQLIVRQKSTMDFLINLTFLVTIFTCLLGVCEFLFQGLSAELTLKLSLFFIAIIFISNMSVQSAAAWGTTIRTAFVIFKEEMRQTLCLRKPVNYEDEKRLWEMTSNFFRAEGPSELQKTWANAIFDTSNYERNVILGEE